MYYSTLLLQIQLVQAEGAELRKLNEKMSFIREYQEGNSNAKMTLLDQKANMEKKRHDTSVKLEFSKQKSEILK